MKNTGFGNTDYSFVFSEVGRSAVPPQCKTRQDNGYSYKQNVYSLYHNPTNTARNMLDFARCFFADLRKCGCDNNLFHKKIQHIHKLSPHIYLLSESTIALASVTIGWTDDQLKLQKSCNQVAPIFQIF